MAKGWRKDDYNRLLFGQKIKAYRLTLQWSLGELAERSNMNKGTLLHVEKGDCHLPNEKRQRVVEVLTEALEKVERPVDRREFLEVASLSTVSAPLSAVSPPPQLQRVEIQRASSQEKIFQAMPHEEYAKLLNQQDQWQQAAMFLLLAAQQAKRHGDWAKWSRCLLGAGQMALNSGQFEVAERRFKEIIGKAEHEADALSVAEAYIRLGWVYYEQDKFSQATKNLLKSRTLLQNLGSGNGRSLHLPEHGCTLVCEDNEVITALESTRLHWLGRTYVDWGIEQDNQTLVKEGVAKLQKSEHYDRQLSLPGSVGFGLLRQIPALLHEGELDTAENYLARSEELLGTRGTVQGHLSLHKGLLALEEQPRRAKDFLESARRGFIEPAFYSRGLAEVLRELSGAYLMDDKKTADERALQYALTATVLYPYSRNVELLQLAAHKMYWRMGENMTAFNTCWQALEEKLWHMDSEPFSDLRYLMKAFQENAIQQVETAIEAAKKAVQKELFSA